MKKQCVIIGSVGFFLILAGLCYSCSYNKPDPYVSLEGAEHEQEDEEVDDEIETEEIEESPKVIYIHICGAVNNPGVYSMNYGDRLTDLVQLAGGFSKDAAMDYMNQAQEVQDGSRIYIPTNEELAHLSVEEHIHGKDGEALEESSEEDGLININKADESQLMMLNGIGEAKAKSIIDYRNSHGEFQQIEDIMKISGIKEGLFNKISDKITVK